MFKVLCEDMMSFYLTLLFVWLSCCKIFTRLFKLRDEIQVVFQDQPFNSHPSYATVIALDARVFI